MISTDTPIQLLFLTRARSWEQREDLDSQLSMVKLKHTREVWQCPSTLLGWRHALLLLKKNQFLGTISLTTWTEKTSARHSTSHLMFKLGHNAQTPLTITSLMSVQCGSTLFLSTKLVFCSTQAILTVQSQLMAPSSGSSFSAGPSKNSGDHGSQTAKFQVTTKSTTVLILLQLRVLATWLPNGLVNLSKTWFFPGFTMRVSET